MWKQLAYAYRIHPKLTKEIANMADKYTRNLEYIAETMGQDLLPFISIEDRLRDLTPAQRLEGIDATQRLEGLDATQRLEGLDATQRLEGLDATQRLEGLSLEDILDALSDEEREALRQLSEAQEKGYLSITK